MQLNWIHLLQNALRSPGMDAFFKAIDAVDTEYSYLIIVCLTWYLWSRRIGVRLFYVLIISWILNDLIKSYTQLPRPCQIDPLVAVVCHGSYSFPSGAAQSAAFLTGIVFIECQKTYCRWLILVFAFLLCFSRVYLGVHYPTDIIGGLIVGSALVLLYSRGFAHFEKKWKMAAVAFPFFVLFSGFLFPEWPSWIVEVFFLTLGVTAGLLTGEKIPIPWCNRVRVRIVQTFFAILGLGVLYVAIHFYPQVRLLWDFCVGYWVSFFGGWVIAKITRKFHF